MAESLNEIVKIALDQQASDIHLESGTAVFLRIRGTLRPLGTSLPYEKVKTWVNDLLGARADTFRAERSIDISETIAGVRCRIHAFHSSRGLSCSIRLLARSQPTLAELNLHPNIQKIVDLRRGLVLISGPTGSGKSSTISALIQELNQKVAYNVVTLEQPIEYVYRNQKCLIRQREVGRDTPTFEKGLIDAMREDPDVIVVGEMRDAETIRQTLNAAETGHLVLATLHSSTVTESIARVLSAFPVEVRGNIASQLAEVLQAVVCQHLAYFEKFALRAAVCELFFTTQAARGKIRSQELASLADTYYAGTEAGCLHAERYRQWLEALPALRKPSVDSTPFERIEDHPEVLKDRFSVPLRRAQGKTAATDVYSIDNLEDDDLWDAIKKLED